MNQIGRTPFFDFVPTPILKEIVEYCDAPTIRNFRVTCKKFRLLIDDKFQELFLTKLFHESNILEKRWPAILQKITNHHALTLLTIFSTHERIQLILEKLSSYNWPIKPKPDELKTHYEFACHLFSTVLVAPETNSEDYEKKYDGLKESYPNWTQIPIQRAAVIFCYHHINPGIRKGMRPQALIDAFEHSFDVSAMMSVPP